MRILSVISNIGKRLIESNNHKLAIVFGCLFGFAVTTVRVIQHKAAIPLIGDPDTLFFQIIGVLVGSGLGGNFSSYIGSAIDTVTGDKTIVDLCRHLFPATEPNDSLDIESQYVTSSKNILTELGAQKKTLVHILQLLNQVQDNRNTATIRMRRTLVSQQDNSYVAESEVSENNTREDSTPSASF